ncbi:polysaccharide biosynthesis protein [Geoanaerobacter pelophilus]|uniref:Polysaccharide biosynthesis protein n=1 Tax=Geoanaerobacter pelophilus TaxID=60036 RepID=A0ABQ0MDU6_9BACT|nr:oligosaccharide flippase family protein [Geoanaerobacter pelophilus]GAW65287.1 polysaccharide biosynthesis protein [Geoanaerobacter pelophilus]
MLWDKIKKSELSRDTLWMLMGHGAQLPIRAVYFVLIARWLGAEGYGAFIGVTALVSVLAPFASMGSGNILIKHVARDRSEFSRYWGRTLLLTWFSGIVLTLATVVLAHFILPRSIPLMLVITVSIADLLFLSILNVCAQAFQGFERLSMTSFLLILPNATRLLALIVLILLKKPTPLDLGYLYLISTGVAFLVGGYLVTRELGRPSYSGRVLDGEVREGLYFSVALCSTTIFNDIDKTMLTRLATLQAAGIYAAAYRLVDVAFIPVRSLISASYARFFRSGAQGMRGTLALVAKLLPFAAGYGLASSLVLFLCAPLLPYIFGREFKEATDALRWLSLLPFLKVLHYFPANALTGAGFQGLRSSLLVGTAFFNISLNLWLIPLYSWRGSAWASLLSDGLYAVIIWAAAVWKLRCCPTVALANQEK